MLLQAANYNGLQQVQRPHSVDLHGVVRGLERLANVRLRRQVVYLAGANLAEDLDEAMRIRDVAFVEDNLAFHLSNTLTKFQWPVSSSCAGG